MCTVHGQQNKKKEGGGGGGNSERSWEEGKQKE